MSVPVLFAPLRHDGRLPIDGGVLDNLPVGLLAFHRLDVVVEVGRMAVRELLEQTGGQFPGAVVRAPRKV